MNRRPADLGAFNGSVRSGMQVHNGADRYSIEIQSSKKEQINKRNTKMQSTPKKEATVNVLQGSVPETRPDPALMRVSAFGIRWVLMLQFSNHWL